MGGGGMNEGESGRTDVPVGRVLELRAGKSRGPVGRAEARGPGMAAGGR